MTKYHQTFPDISNVASSTECTGLMPTVPHSENAYASLQELSGMEIPADDE